MVAGPFNPNNPQVLGDEWFTLVQGGYQLGTSGACIAMDLTTQFTDDGVDSLWFYYGPWTDPGTGVWQAMVYNGGEPNAVLAAPYTTYGTANLFTPIFDIDGGPSAGTPPTNGTGCMQLLPASDVARSNVTGSPDNTNLYFNVDAPIPDWGTAASITFTANNSSYEWAISSIATPRGFPGRQITGVLVGIYARQGSSGSTLRASLKIGGQYYQGTPWQGGADANAHYYFYEWTINPATGLPWTSAEMDALSSSISIRLKQQMGGATTGWRVYETSVFVNFIPENRLALGTNGAPELEAWNEFQLITPTYYNMFSADESSFETSTANWVAGSNTTIVTSASQAYAGTKSLRLTPTAPGTMSARSTIGGSSGWPMPVIAGLQYWYQTQIRSASTGRTATPSIHWLDANQVLISSTSGTPTADNSAGWTQIEVDTAVAPPTAAFAYVSVSFAAANENHFIDGNMFTANQAANPASFILGGSANGLIQIATGEDLMVILYKLPGGSGGPSVNVLDSGSAIPMPPGNDFNTYLPQMVSPAGLLSDTGDAQTFGFGLLLSAGSAVETGLQPYARMDSRLVQSGATAQQIISVPIADDYGRIKAVVSLTSETVTEALNISVHENSGGNPQVGQTYTVLPSDLSMPRTAPQVISVDPLVATTLSITGLATYYILFESDDLEGWNIWLQDTHALNNEPFGAEFDTYGDATDFGEATFSDPAFDTQTDFMVTISSLPDTPDCFTVVTV